MIRQVLRGCFVVCLLALLAAGCSDTISSPSASTTTSTTTTSTTTATELFDGTLASGGSNIHVFHTLPGVFSVTLASIAPSDVVPPLGMAYGMWDGTSCTGVLGTVSAVASLSMTGTASVETDVCIRMWDPNGWEQGLVLTYTVTALHYKKAS